MQQIQNYELLEKLKETKGSVIYRGRKVGEDHPIIVKLLKSKLPSPSDIARFKQEYEIIKSINLAGVIKTYDIISHSGAFALILEDFDGVSLKSILVKDKPFDINSFLKIASTICETLGELHKRDIIHRDIKPHNILINQNDLRIKITDFGISTVLTRENDEIYNSDVIEGTLHYISPEQTGRMNRTVDYRTDLYSLGITFYEMLTGAVPFESHDPLEVIHSHIARKPVPPVERNVAIPVTVSDIIMKLISKNAEDRYQNAFGLLHDLNECVKGLTDGKIKSFELAAKDISNRFIIPQKLFGREKEITTLISSFDRACGSSQTEKNKPVNAEIILVSGSPGVGKSALIHEINKPITARRGYFISGKYEQFRRDKPYSGIIQALQQLISQILAESEEMIDIWKKNILDAVGNNGKIIINMIPMAEMIIGVQPDVPDLSAKEERNRFSIVFENFIGVFAKQDHPVTLFLDDLQWADLASIHLIKKLVTNNNIKYMLIIGSYRDNEVNDAHPLQQTIQEIEKAGVTINRLLLSSLTVNHVKDMIVNFLKCSEQRGLSLAEIVFKKTNGNPFFVTEFLRTLYHDRIIEPDAALGWNWDIDRISQMHVTDNVVDLMADNIKTLPAEVQDILKTCACIGNRFDLETLSILIGKSIVEVLTNLMVAIQEGLIGMSGDQYIFHHDRIQEAAYSFIPDADKPTAHYRIGRLMLEKTPESELQNKLFYITDQMNLGSKLITDSGERAELARMNLDCGKKAKASIAYSTASGYLQTGMNLLEKNCWDTQYDLTLALYTELIEVASLAGDFAKMNSLTEMAISKARRLLDKANIYKAKITACIAQEDIGGALTAGMLFTGLTGHKSTGTKKEILKRYINFRIAYFGKSDKRILNLPEMTDPVRIAANEVGSQLAYALYTVAPNILVSGIFSNVVEALQYGLSPQIGANICGLGLVLISGFNDIERGYRFGKLGMEIAEKHKKTKARAIYVFNTQIRHWKEHLRNTIEPYTEGYQLGIESGDLLYAADNLGMQNSHNFMIGKNLIELEQDIEKNTQIIKGLSQMQIYSKNSILLQLVQNLLGKTDDPIKLVGKTIDETKSVPQWTATNNRLLLATYYTTKIFIDMIFHNYSDIIKDLDIQSKYIESIAGSWPFREFAFYDSIGRLAVYPTASKEEKRLYLKRVRKNLKKIKKWAKFAPMNNLHLYHLVKAELARVLGQHSAAEKSYDLAIEQCRKNEYLYNEMHFNELAARYYLSIGNNKLARSYLIDAFECCSRWGAAAKLMHMLDMYSDLIPSSLLLPISSSDDSMVTITGSSTQIIDISTVVKASQTISGEVALGKLLAKMMKIAIENAGAQRGFMILEENEMLMVEAESTIENEEVRVLESIPVDSCGRLSAAIVHYVARTKEILILNNAPIEGNFTKDPYVVQYNPKSILCAPIINQGKLTGVLYLENNLSTRAFTQERLEVLNILSSQMAISIDNAKLYEHLEEKVKQRTEELRAATEALWGEMELAKKIQTVLLPENPVINGYKITGHMKPADLVGGDYYDIINTGSCDWVIIGDVSGHGVPAGLVMMMVQTSIQALVREFPDIDPSKLLSIVNEAIKYNVGKMEEDKYMTISAFRFKNDGSVLYSGLHQEPFIYRSALEDVEILPTEGMWLSPWDMGDTDISQEFKFNQGDTLLLYTDGITEARDKKGMLFTDEKLADILKKYGKLKTYEIKDKILESLEQYTLEDDVTMVVIKKN